MISTVVVGNGILIHIKVLFLYLFIDYFVYSICLRLFQIKALFFQHRFGLRGDTLIQFFSMAFCAFATAFGAASLVLSGAAASLAAAAFGASSLATSSAL